MILNSSLARKGDALGKRGAPLALLFLLTVSLAGFAHEAHNCFPSRAPQAFAIIPQERVTETEMRAIFQALSAMHGQEIAAHGGFLRVFETEKMEFGAFAWREHSDYAIEVYRGTRFHKLMTADAYALIVCHEFGHHLGGLPLKRLSSWASAEGQADYYGSLKCMRRYLESRPPGDFDLAPPPPLELTARCQQEFDRPLDVRICARALAATRTLGEVTADIEGFERSRFPTLETNSPLVVIENRDSHPDPQCRLDTLRAGTLCPVPATEAVSYGDPDAGVCHMRRHPQHRRPPCWFLSVDPEVRPI
ncbi:MAG: hypothetical protein AB7G93_12320 [Bdellovibrionales bacterium]